MTLSRNLRRFLYKAFRQPGYAARVMAKRALAWLYYMFGDGRSPPPEAITLFLTHRCNLHCSMCGQWGEGGVTKRKTSRFIKEELPAGKIGSFIDEVACFGPNITLFGGEPLLYYAALETIKHVKDKGLHCLVITNGYLLEEDGKELVDIGLDELNVSLDGGEALHDDIRGMPGLYRKIMCGLKIVRDEKKALGRPKPLVNIQCTVTKRNCAHLEQMIDVAKDAGADSLTFHNLIFTDRPTLERQRSVDERLKASSEDWEGFAFEPGVDPERLYDKMRGILSGSHPFGVDFYPNFTKEELISYYKGPGFRPRGYPAGCLSPWIAAYVFPDGEVRPCLNSTYSFGNIKGGKFPDIWNSPRALDYRRFLKKSGVFPACARCTELYRY